MKLRLKAMRSLRGLTIDEAVELTGLSRGFISQLENGKREPSAETLHQLAAAFGVQVHEMIDAGPESEAMSNLVATAQGLSQPDLDALILMAESLKARVRR